MFFITDKQIKEDLLRELRHNSRFGAMNLEVSVNEYVVTLTGNVENANDSLLAQEVACSIEGVHRVVNNIKVKGQAQMRTDGEIAQAVRHALEWDALIPDEKIQSTVSNGWVGLEGTVNFLHEREDAELLIRRLAGVRGVYNEIVVNSSEVKAENVRETIEGELKRRAELGAKSIEVLTKDGAVILSGRVQSWEERCAIINAASRAPGVGAVKDRPAINPYF